MLMDLTRLPRKDLNRIHPLHDLENKRQNILFKTNFTHQILTFLMALMLSGCDPADTREFNVSLAGGEWQLSAVINEIDPLATECGFQADPLNGKLREGGLVASWRRKLRPNDENTRIACFVFFDSKTNSGKVQLILFPGNKLPDDAVKMFEDLKTRLPKLGVVIHSIKK